MALSASMLINVMNLSVVTTTRMVPTVSVIILMAVTMALVLMVTTQPAMIPSVLISMSVSVVL